MLGELKAVSQDKTDPGRRRWFADEEMDLIVWYTEAGGLDGFQLCYDKTGDEHAFTWKTRGGLVHTRIDAGEDLPSDNRTPILVPDGLVPLGRVLGEFKARAAELEPDLVRFVCAKLAGRAAAG